MSAIHVRTGHAADLPWVNARYAEIDFVPSDLDRDHIAVAEVGGVRIGVGRLVRVEPSARELGGMWVDPSQRGRGAARRIVQFLLARRAPDEVVYCLPFAHLADFYGSFGFVACPGGAAVPVEVAEKHRWCNETYPHPVLLLVLDPA